MIISQNARWLVITVIAAEIVAVIVIYIISNYLIVRIKLLRYYVICIILI